MGTSAEGGERWVWSAQKDSTLENEAIFLIPSS